MGVCSMCSKRMKDWDGDDPKCAFPDGVFTSENWNCATANAIRDIAENHQINFGDERVALLNADSVGFTCLVVTWYKRRGRTQSMWLISDFEAPRLPSELEVLEIINPRAW